MDWNGPLPDTEELQRVEVTTTLNPLEERDYRELQQMISPLSPSDCHGVDVYIRTLEFVVQKLA